MAWLLNNASLQKAADVINGLDGSKFPLLLGRITQTMQQDSEKARPFTAAEVDKLQTSLALDKQDVSLLLDSLTLIFRKAACHMTKPQVLQQQLTESLKLDTRKAEAIASSWAAAAKGIVDKLRHKSLFSAVLEDVRWNLNLQVASSAHGRKKLPTAVFQLGLRSDGKVTDLNLQFGHEELYTFYEELERIQSQLDALR